MQSTIKKKRNEAAVMDVDGIRKAILEDVAASPARLTPQYLAKTILETYGLDKTRAKAVLKDLVARGQLEYTYEFGSTFLVRSFNEPVRMWSSGRRGDCISRLPMTWLSKLIPEPLSATAGIRPRGFRSKPLNIYSRLPMRIV
jgi:hypothetical protein